MSINFTSEPGATLLSGLSRVPDLVAGTRLETSFTVANTIHVHDDDSSCDDDGDDGGPRLSRNSQRVEYWETERILNMDTANEVLVQRCVMGARKGDPKKRAVKPIPLQLAGRMDYIRELEAVAKFSQRRYSKYFVKMLGWYEDPLCLCVVTEHFTLGDLESYMAENAPMDEAAAREVACQVLEALREMHREGFTHGDIKPANILIKSHPPHGGWWVKVSNFDVGRRVRISAGQTHHHSADNGTAYMAPELFSHEDGGALQTDPVAADTWSLGETAFVMLAGTAAFPSQLDLVCYLSSIVPRP